MEEGFISIHEWPGRLFDRDTKFIAIYEADFINLIKLYAEDNLSKKQDWKQKVLETVWNDFRRFLEKKFDFTKSSSSVKGTGMIISHGGELIKVEVKA